MPPTLEDLQALPLELLIKAVVTHPARARRNSTNDFAAVLSLTSAIFDVDQVALLGPGRPQALASARMAGMATLYDYGQHYGITTIRVGELFGNRDHGTVIHAQKRTEQLFATEPVFADRLRTLRRMLALPPQPPRKFLKPLSQASLRL